MKVVAALLAAVLATGAGVAGCGEDGAEPGASQEATLVLDFQPNAVHAGIYAALRAGRYADASVDLEIREPTAATDAPRLVETGRADLAILTITDLGTALERGLSLRPVAEIVQRPLGAVIAADRTEVRRPRDLEGRTVGVTGLPSDDAVLDALLEADGADPAAVERIDIGFDSVAALAAGRLDAATAFWSAEGVTLRRLGVPTREFRLDEHGAPRYPELLLVASAATAEENAELIDAVVAATAAGYRELRDAPDAALADLLAEVPDLDSAEQRAQLETLLAADAFSDPTAKPDLGPWLRFAGEAGIVDAAAVRAELRSSGAGS